MKSTFLVCLLFSNEVWYSPTKIVSARQFRSDYDSKQLGEEARSTGSWDLQSTMQSNLPRLKKAVGVVRPVRSVPYLIANAGSPARQLRQAEAPASETALSSPQDTQVRAWRPWRIFSRPRAPVRTKGEELAKTMHGLRSPSVSPVNKSAVESSWLSELWLVHKIGLPLGFSSSARILQIVSISIVLGRSNTLLLAAVSASSIWTQITDNMAFTGIGQLSTLCGQAYGAGNKKLVGTWLQIALVGVVVAGIPSMGLRWFTSPILKLLGIRPQLAELAGKFAVWGQTTFLFNTWYYAVQRYYLAQQIVIPDAVVDAIFIFVNVAIVYLFVHVLNFGQDGIVGAAIGTSVSGLLRLIVYVVYCWGKGFHRDTWFGWSWKEIAHRQRWKTLLKMVGPAAISGLLQQLQFQFCSLLAVRLGPPCAAAFNLCLQLLLLSFVSVFSLGGATGNRLSRLLGAGEPAAARFTCKVGLAACWGGTLFLAGLLAAVMGPFSRLASHDVRVQMQLQSLRWTAAAATALLGGFISLVTVLSTQGRPHLAAIVTPVTCWAVGFPISYFSSKTRGLLGIFDGLDAGYGLALISLLIPYFMSDWPRLAAKAQKRAEKRKEVKG